MRGVGERVGAYLLSRVVREGLKNGKIIVKEKNEGIKSVSHEDIWKKIILDPWNNNENTQR